MKFIFLSLRFLMKIFFFGVKMLFEREIDTGCIIKATTDIEYTKMTNNLLFPFISCYYFYVMQTFLFVTHTHENLHLPKAYEPSAAADDSSFSYILVTHNKIKSLVLFNSVTKHRFLVMDPQLTLSAELSYQFHYKNSSLIFADINAD